jgi:hypothetical protein
MVKCLFFSGQFGFCARLMFPHLYRDRILLYEVLRNEKLYKKHRDISYINYVRAAEEQKLIKIFNDKKYEEIVFDDKTSIIVNSVIAPAEPVRCESYNSVFTFFNYVTDSCLCNAPCNHLSVHAGREHKALYYCGNIFHNIYQDTRSEKKIRNAKNDKKKGKRTKVNRKNYGKSSAPGKKFDDIIEIEF